MKNNQSKVYLDKIIPRSGQFEVDLQSWVTFFDNSRRQLCVEKVLKKIEKTIRIVQLGQVETVNLNFEGKGRVGFKT